MCKSPGLADVLTLTNPALVSTPSSAGDVPEVSSGPLAADVSLFDS